MPIAVYLYALFSPLNFIAVNLPLWAPPMISFLGGFLLTSRPFLCAANSRKGQKTAPLSERTGLVYIAFLPRSFSRRVPDLHSPLFP
jgi:hypothetical protein